ncbi:MAG: DUF4102 domain-containing protein [Nevskiaceae bacterium]|jgi:hypothetical protein|nr:MAG: DUF4102 domain-containing protein [Nevskiaceae bacterium]TAM27368.1 MAG: DUF4102 domain-containing protein [Nevskiaceae bacterium]
MPPAQLTDPQCRNAKPKAGKSYKLAAGGGLYLEVFADGAKRWRWKYRINGKEKRLALGVYGGQPHVTLKDAQLAREQARRLLSAGVDPSEERQARKAAGAEATANSFAAFTAEWLGNQSLAASTRDKLERRLERDILPYLGKRPIAEIKPAELLAVLRRIEERSVDTAHQSAN